MNLPARRKEAEQGLSEIDEKTRGFACKASGQGSESIYVRAAPLSALRHAAAVAALAKIKWIRPNAAVLARDATHLGGIHVTTTPVLATTLEHLHFTILRYGPSNWSVAFYRDGLCGVWVQVG